MLKKMDWLESRDCRENHPVLYWTAEFVGTTFFFVTVFAMTAVAGILN